MKLEKFRVTHYRSVSDSGWIDVTQRTALVGRNESGKSNVLHALHALNPPGGLQRMSVAEDFPRSRARSDYNHDLEVVRTTWELSDDEREALGLLFPRAKHVTSVEVARGYEPERWVRFGHLPVLEAPVEEAKDLFARLQEAAEGAGGDDPLPLERALEKLEDMLGRAGDGPLAWANSIREVVDDVERCVDVRGFERGEEIARVLGEIRELLRQVSNDSQAEADAREWVLQQLPVFLYLEDFPEIDGHQDLERYLERQRENRREPGDEYFARLMAVSELDPAELHELMKSDPEARRQMVNRAGAVVTRKLRSLWTERPLKVRFNLDGPHLDTMVSDPNSLYEVEVNLNQRSRGLRWFFSFYITFAAEADDQARKAILLLDEPGLHLHALGQRDLLEHFASDFANQVIYSTHSPFMVPTGDLDAVRTVSIDEEDGTCVHNTPTGDPETLFPILHALGVELAQGLFSGKWSLVTEQVSDYWYLSAVSHFLREHSRPHLPKGLQVVPSGAAAKIPFMVALLTTQRMRTLVLLGEDPAARLIGDDLVASELLREGNVLFLGDSFEEAPEEGADIEDLLDPEVYDRLVRESYARALNGKTLELDEGTPRIVKRYEQAFRRIGLPFSRTRPARLFLRRMAESPQRALPTDSRLRFERLFAAVRQKLEALRDAEPARAEG